LAVGPGGGLLGETNSDMELVQNQKARRRGKPSCKKERERATTPKWGGKSKEKGKRCGDLTVATCVRGVWVGKDHFQSTRATPVKYKPYTPGAPILAV